MDNKLSYQELVRLSMGYLLSPYTRVSDMQALLNNRDNGNGPLTENKWFKEALTMVLQIKSSVL